MLVLGGGALSYEQGTPATRVRTVGTTRGHRWNFCRMVWPGQLDRLLSPHGLSHWVNVLSLGAGFVTICADSFYPSALQCQFSKTIIADPPCGAELSGSWRPFSLGNHWLMGGTARIGPTRAGCTWPC